MLDLPRHHLLAYLLATAVVLFVGVRSLTRHGPPSAGAAPLHFARPSPAAGGSTAAGEAGGLVVVDVSGAVHRPGVYRLRAGARIDDAIRRAGGVTRHADLTTDNLAAKLDDGRQILVPRRAGAGAVSATAVAPAAGAPAGPVNLNTATPEQLDTLDGVGPAMIKKILDFRAQHGGFKTVDDLDQIPGIGPARLAALRPEVTV